MSIKSDRWIRQMAVEKKMIEPFEEGQVRNGVISFGTSSYGYDIRVADEYKFFTNVYSPWLTPSTSIQNPWWILRAIICIIPPNSLCLWLGLWNISVSRGPY